MNKAKEIVEKLDLVRKSLPEASPKDPPGVQKINTIREKIDDAKEHFKQFTEGR